jgi:hypothetical protein
VFASLIPDPDDPECPESFSKQVMDLLKHERYRPNGEVNGETVEDTPRNRCLEFIKHLVRWENSNNPEFIEPARQMIGAAHKFLHPGADGDTPRLLDPFAGGGAIPLEALRLGCEAHAIDLNPVAHLIELCTLVYPQKHGRSESRPVPEYIKRLVALNQAKKKAKGQAAYLTVRMMRQTSRTASQSQGLTSPKLSIRKIPWLRMRIIGDTGFRNVRGGS